MIGGEDEGTEAEALDASGFHVEIEGEKPELYVPMDQHFKMTDFYALAVKAKTGDSINCPGCGRRFKKESYQQKFCSNEGRSNCKDYYHNATDFDRFERMKRINGFK